LREVPLSSEDQIDAEGVWLPRMLYWICLGVAASLLALVFLSPLLDNGQQETAEGWRVVFLFAADTTLRRTAVAAAIGLAVTAQVFFRSSASLPTDT
jgi:hypothetical protein